MSLLLEAQGLHTYYGSSHVLRGADVMLESGSGLGLLGRNGMGKTTLLRTLLGHLVPRRGSVRLRDRDVTGMRPDRIARMGVAYVPEGRGIFPNLAVRENLVMASRPGFDGRTLWTFERVLETFPRLAERLDHGGSQLSGGEQQMLSIGRALLTNPELLILDEATEGLAPQIAKEIWRVIDVIRESGVSTIIVDRNYGAVIAHADRCVILVKGEAVFNGSSAELRDNSSVLHQHLGV
jgi:branched-chain amino acid transport system ATP-binding protein